MREFLCKISLFSVLMYRASLFLCCSWWFSRNSLWQKLGIETMTSSFTTSSYSVSTKRKEGEDKMVSQLCVAPCKCWILRTSSGRMGKGRDCVCPPLDRDEWFPSCLCHFTLWVRTPSTLWRRGLVGHRACRDVFGEREKSPIASGFQTAVSPTSSP